MGKLKNARDPDGGFALVDLMIALIITGVASVVLFSAISVATRTTGRLQERLSGYMARQNEYAETKTIDFAGK